MYPNLMGQKTVRKMTDEEMAKVIGVTRGGYLSKLERDTFTVTDCKRFCEFFRLPFEYLFATQDELLKQRGTEGA